MYSVWNWLENWLTKEEITGLRTTTAITHPTYNTRIILIDRTNRKLEESENAVANFCATSQAQRGSVFLQISVTHIFRVKHKI